MMKTVFTTSISTDDKSNNDSEVRPLAVSATATTSAGETFLLDLIKQFTETMKIVFYTKRVLCVTPEYGTPLY